MNRADDSIALSNAITHLLSGKATNLEAFHLAIKGFAVKCAQQRGHQIECKLNGKSSAKTNPYFARIAKEAPTHELEAKAKAKAERDEVEGASAEQVALTTEIVKTERKLVNALKEDQRLKRVKTKVGNLRAKVSRLQEQLAKTKQSRQTV